VSTTENIGRCPRCHKFMIAEQSKTHVCDKSKSDVCDFSNRPFVGCEELVLHRLTDSGEDSNGDHVYLAWGINRILYRLLVCKHYPSHSAEGSPLGKAIECPGGGGVCRPMTKQEET
jgi:ssDNA-binding Zn-finger/Zn-ribbon topoisomerase 1